MDKLSGKALVVYQSSKDRPAKKVLVLSMGCMGIACMGCSAMHICSMVIICSLLL